MSGLQGLPYLWVLERVDVAEANLQPRRTELLPVEVPVPVESSDEDGVAESIASSEDETPVGSPRRSSERSASDTGGSPAELPGPMPKRASQSSCRKRPAARADASGSDAKRSKSTLGGVTSKGQQTLSVF